MIRSRHMRDNPKTALQLRPSGVLAPSLQQALASTSSAGRREDPSGTSAPDASVGANEVDLEWVVGACQSVWPAKCERRSDANGNLASGGRPSSLSCQQPASRGATRIKRDVSCRCVSCPLKRPPGAGRRRMGPRSLALRLTVYVHDLDLDHQSLKTSSSLSIQNHHAASSHA
jgi:hypothetical protein